MKEMAVVINFTNYESIFSVIVYRLKIADNANGNIQVHVHVYIHVHVHVHVL